jgi:hypothetical protein
LVDVIAIAWMSEAQQTERFISGLIVLLLVVAALLTVLTIWYWNHTNPKRRARGVAQQGPIDLNRTQGQIGADPTMVQPTVPSDGYVPSGPRR